MSIHNININNPNNSNRRNNFSTGINNQILLYSHYPNPNNIYTTYGSYIYSNDRISNTINNTSNSNIKQTIVNNITFGSQEKEYILTFSPSYIKYDVL